MSEWEKVRDDERVEVWRLDEEHASFRLRLDSIELRPTILILQVFPQGAEHGRELKRMTVENYEEAEERAEELKKNAVKILAKESL